MVIKMNAYITKLNGMGNTLQSVQHMTAEIAHQLGFREMGIYYYNANAEKPEHRSVRFDGVIAGMQAGDIVVCQFHTWNGLRFERALVEHIRAYRGRVVIFIHSLEALMIRGSRFMLQETIELYNRAEALIVPSQEMKKFLLDSGIRAGMKFIVQEMWDYTTEIRFPGTPGFKKEIHCTGGADSPFVNDWDYDVPLKLYTSAAAQGKNVHSMGALNQDKLLYALSEGGFGLEWYHDDQAYEYMKYGNSVSLSRYLAAGIPVIVPAGISCQKLIEENGLGLVVSSLDEAVQAVEAMSEAEYQEYVRHVAQFAPALRNGYYTRKCLTDSVLALFREDIGKAYVQAEDIYDLGSIEFKAASLKESYGGKLALSWAFNGTPDGFLIYDSKGELIEETGNGYQHYLLLKGQGQEEGLVIKAYVNTRKGKMIVAKTAPIYPDKEPSGQRLISLIMPVYNAEDYIARSIDTVLAQTFPDMELVLVDDGSTDHTPGILDWYAEKYPNIVVTHQKNGGVPAARNTGIELAKGEYIAFMDNDDMIRPDMMEKLYTSIRKNDCDIAATSIYQIVNGRYETGMQYPVEEDIAIPMDEFLRIYASNGYALFSIWNKLYRASLVKNCRFPLIMFDDEAWTPYILSHADKICYLDGGLYEYDRSIRNGTLVDKWFRKEKDEIFQDHKRAILFYLEHGNPKRMELLKEFAKSELGLFSRTTGYEEYKKMYSEVANRE
ncbi:MAG: glycosyltransferase [Butyrivibrio sp.]|nr:glycosyltransferase [Ruminococcus flavefaciens]MCM1561203.1 glycosyltransferase [Butyrivibrio sp.]